MSTTVHRAETGRSYRGIPMHAAGGVHEYAVGLLEQLLPTGSRVLDVGTGSGALAARLQAHGYGVTAADLDGSDFRGGCPFVSWDVTSPITPPEIVPASVDGVCAVEILEHLENPAQALRNLFALLRPGGILVLSTPNLAHPRSRMKFLLRGAPAYFGPAEFFASGHRTLLPHWMLPLLLEEAGFEVLSVSFAGSMGLRPASRLAYAFASPVFTILRMQPRPRTGDGCITFATARKPS